MNKAMILGRIGEDPDVKTTAAGQQVCNFSVATTEKVGQGPDQKERTEWHRVTAWGKLAERCHEQARKGKLVFVEGRLQTRKYTANTGEERKVTEIVAAHLMFGPAAHESPRPVDPEDEIPF